MWRRRVAWVPMYIGICPWFFARGHGQASACPCHPTEPINSMLTEHWCSNTLESSGCRYPQRRDRAYCSEPAALAAGPVRRLAPAAPTRQRTHKTTCDHALVCRQPRMCGLALSDGNSKVRSLTVAVRILVAAEPASLCVAMLYCVEKRSGNAPCPSHAMMRVFCPLRSS